MPRAVAESGIDSPPHAKTAMDANAYKLVPKLMNPLIKGMIQKAIENDMDAVKTYCEAQQ